MRVLAIDPGYERVGIAVLEHDIPREKLLFSSCFLTHKEAPFEERLTAIGTEIQRLIKIHKPDAFAIEELFFNSNQKTALRVAEARGVMRYEASRAGLTFFEYTPLQIKMAITGYGRGDKRQVGTMVRQLIVCPQKMQYDDELDAIAVGLTALASERTK